VDLVADLHGKRSEDDQAVQEDKDCGVGVVLEVLAGQNGELGEHLRREDNPEEEAVAARQGKGTLAVPQLVYEIRIHQQLSHPNVVHLDHWFEDENYQYIFMEYCAEGVSECRVRICRSDCRRRPR
jgi:serine/threonine protein kinase